VTRTLGLAAVAVLATGCDGKWVRGGWPSPITTQGKNALGVWQGNLIAAACVGGFVIALILGSALFFRRRNDDLPRQVRYNVPIEVLYTVVPVIIISILFYFTAIRENDVDSKKTPNMVVGVVGFQWSWQFIYPDTGQQSAGLAVTGRPGDPPTLVLPEDTTVRFYESSPDVVHSFWVPEFLFKRDVIPGHPNSFQLHIMHKTGTFSGYCTELCGIDHDRMIFKLQVVTKAQFQQWLSQKLQVAQAGSNAMFTSYDPGSFANDVIGNKQKTQNGNTQRSTQ